MKYVLMHKYMSNTNTIIVYAEVLLARKHVYLSKEVWTKTLNDRTDPVSFKIFFDV